jgi:hypothetical protein
LPNFFSGSILFQNDRRINTTGNHQVQILRLDRSRPKVSVLHEMWRHPICSGRSDIPICTVRRNNSPTDQNHQITGGNMKHPQIRQGDLLLIAIACSLKPKSTKKENHIPLLDGEATGHVHAIECDTEIKRLEYDEKDLHDWLESIGIASTGICGLEVEAPAKLTHQEHSVIDVPVGKYIAIRQREYTPEAIRNVQD